MPERAINAWRHFWFRPTPTYTLGAVRILFGAIVVLWTLSLLGDLDDLFSTYGVVPAHRGGTYENGVFEFWAGDRALMIGWALLLISAIALTVGWHSRLAALLVFVLVLSFEFRNPFVFNSGDALLRIEALLLALSPCGAALSLDQRRAGGKFWSAQMRAPWALRLLQFQLSLIYISTFQVRMTGNKWPEGTALSYAFRLEDMLIIPLPHWVVTSAELMNLATWGTLVLELVIGILVWNRRCRRYVLTAGVALHSIILVTVAVGFFTPAMFVLYLAFIDPETIRRLPETVKSAVHQRFATDQRETPSRSDITDRVST
ncbi:HTTM domain-containing protein [Mycolicibacterium rutilum]|nr:HTTM domain-containing protein [Mycolicibacterium rutilum]